MAREVRQVRSVSALSPSAWSWLLSWVRTQPEAAVSPAVLLELCEQWESTTFKAEVIRTALGHPDRLLSRDNYDRGQTSIDSLPSDWLRDVLVRSVRQEPPAVPDSGPEETPDETEGELGHTDRAGPTLHSRHAYTLLMALILVETEESLDAAAALLQHPWSGHNSLVSAFWSRANALEQETREVWIERLRPPPPADPPG